MDRRSFVVSATAGLLTPAFLKDVTRTIERTAAPLLVPPDKPFRTLYALRSAKLTGPGFFYDLWMDTPEEDLNDDFFCMTWREYLVARGYSISSDDCGTAKLLLEYYADHLALNGETDDQRLKEARVLLDKRADAEFLADEWKSWGSPQGKAYKELLSLDLGPDPRLHRGIGSINFIDSPSLGYYASSVEVDGCLSLSLLQGRLNELGTGLEIEIQDI